MSSGEHLWVALGRADLTQMTRFRMRGLKLPVWHRRCRSHVRAKDLLPAESPAWGPSSAEDFWVLKRELWDWKDSFKSAGCSCSSMESGALFWPWSALHACGSQKHADTHTHTHKINKKKEDWLKPLRREWHCADLLLGRTRVSTSVYAWIDPGLKVRLQPTEIRVLPLFRKTLRVQEVHLMRAGEMAQ